MKKVMAVSLTVGLLTGCESSDELQSVDDAMASSLMDTSPLADIPIASDGPPEADAIVFDARMDGMLDASGLSNDVGIDAAAIRDASPSVDGHTERIVDTQVPVDSDVPADAGMVEGLVDAEPRLDAHFNHPDASPVEPVDPVDAEPPIEPDFIFEECRAACCPGFSWRRPGGFWSDLAGHTPDWRPELPNGCVFGSSRDECQRLVGYTVGRDDCLPDVCELCELNLNEFRVQRSYAYDERGHLTLESIREMRISTSVMTSSFGIPMMSVD